ncbi:MAG: hypothetical protein KIS61_08810 [Candidatus Eremiobacteraeota bacterium]|nr:hypothetical protein [Candidatus Eremiobacteraeota bacterium]
MRKTLLLLLLSTGLSARPELARPPVHLTSSDGVGLRLTQYRAKVAVQGPLAFTELHLKFHNPQDRVLEGRFEITLPEGAALSRLAMKNEKGWQEAEVVELQQARQAYEDFLHRRQDPALLEKQAGNQFQARVFPIPSGGHKELILSYSQESLGDYRLPLGGLPKVDDLSVEATVWNGQTYEKLNYSLRSEAPKGDFQIHQPKNVSPGLVNGQDVLLVVKPQVKVTVTDKQEKALILVDTSASRAAGYAKQVQLIRTLESQWKKARIDLAAFDQEVVPITQQQLAQRRPLGATDLNKALHWASQQKGYDRLVIVSDGVNTVTQAQPHLKNFARLDVIMVGGIRDSQTLQPLAYQRKGYILDGEKPVTELVQRLQSPSASSIQVAVKGADWVWPNRLDGLAPGEERVVYAHLHQPTQEAEVSLGGQSYKQSLVTTPQPLLHRSAVAANLNRLNLQYKQARGSQKEQIGHHMVELSTGNRVVCDLTGLLVLETEDDYKRFKIDRRALSDILVAGDQGVRVEKRSDIAPASAKAAPGGAADSLSAGHTPPMARPAPSAAAPAIGERRNRVSTTRPQPEPYLLEREEALEDGVAPLNGTFAQIDRLLKQHQARAALQLARQWQSKEPGDVLALVALGRSLQATGQLKEAARAYGSLIDLYPGRADLRRYAGALLESLSSSNALAIDSFTQAVQQRPDHPSGARMLAYSLVKAGRTQEAFNTLEKALIRKYPEGRFADVQEILQDDLGMVAAALITKIPTRDRESSKSSTNSESNDRNPACVLCSPGKPTPTTLTSTSKTPKAATPTTRNPTCLQAADSTPTSPPATGPSASTFPAAARRGPTTSPFITTPEARWATAWAKCRS